MLLTTIFGWSGKTVGSPTLSSLGLGGAGVHSQAFPDPKRWFFFLSRGDPGPPKVAHPVPPGGGMIWVRGQPPH